MPTLEIADLDFQSNVYLILANKYLFKILKLNFDTAGLDVDQFDLRHKANQNLLFLFANLYHNLSILLPRNSLDSQLGGYLLDLNNFKISSFR